MDEPRRPRDERPRDGFGVRAGGHARDAVADAVADAVPPVARESAAGRPAVTIAPPDPAVPAAGALLLGRYRLTGRLAAGTADVWRAEDELLGRAVALKLVVAATRGTAAADRLLAEARALAAIRHPGVVGLHDVLAGAWGTALVLELLPGETLAARLQRDGPVSAPIAISVTMQLAAALDAIHRAGLVHRDVKAGNVMVRADGAVRLIDFGIARPAGERSGLTPDGQVEGTLRAIAPEQLAGGPVAPTADLFGLGTVLFELLEGRPPFDADDPARLARLHRLGRPPVILAPQPLADLLGRLLEPNPAARPASAATVLDQLRAISGALGAGGSRAAEPARAPTQPRAARRRRSRWRVALSGGAVTLVAAGAVTAVLAFPGTGDEGAGRGGSGRDGIAAQASPGRASGPARAAGAIGPTAAATARPSPTPRPTPTATPRPTRTPRPTLPTGFGVDDPASGSTTRGTAVLVRGHAPPRTTVTRDVPLWFDEHIRVDADGRWSVVVQLSPGENVLRFRLGDDRSTEAVIRVTSDTSRSGAVSGG